MKSTQQSKTSISTQVSLNEVKILNQPDHIKLMNYSQNRIVFRIRTAKKKATTTATGCLDSQEAAVLRVKCDGKDTNDRITIEWTIIPMTCEKIYRSEYFLEENESMIVRKNIPCQFSNIVAVLATFEKVQ